MKKIINLFLIIICSFIFTSSIYASTNISLCASGCDYDNLDDALDFGDTNGDVFIHIMDDKVYELTRDHEFTGSSQFGSAYIRISNADEGGSNPTDTTINIEGNNHTLKLNNTKIIMLYYGNTEFNISNLNIQKDPTNEYASINYMLDGSNDNSILNINNCNFSELKDGGFGSDISKQINIKDSSIQEIGIMIHKVNIYNSSLNTIGNLGGTLNIYNSSIPKFNYIKGDYFDSLYNPDHFEGYNVVDYYSNDFGYPEDQVNTYFHTKKDKIIVEGNSVELNELLDDIVKDREAEGSSEDVTVAKVENGKVVALKEGKTTLTVTTDTGHYIHNISLTVIKKEKTNKKGIITVKEKGKIKLAEVFEVLSDYDGEIEWTISDPSVAKIENGEIIPLKSGTITITTVIDGVTYTYDLTITDNVPEKIMHTTIKVPITGKEIEIWVIISVVMLILVIVGTINLLILKKRKSNNKDLNENKKDE